MSAQVSLYGRLGSDPREIPTRTGTKMATVSLAVDLAEGADEATEWFGLLAFGRIAETLAGHRKGDPLSACGRLQLHRWTAPDGTERQQWQCVCDAVLSARTTRPGGGRKRDARRTARQSEYTGELAP